MRSPALGLLLEGGELWQRSPLSRSTRGRLAQQRPRCFVGREGPSFSPHPCLHVPLSISTEGMQPATHSPAARSVTQAQSQSCETSSDSPGNSPAAGAESRCASRYDAAGTPSKSWNCWKKNTGARTATHAVNATPVLTLTQNARQERDACLCASAACDRNRDGTGAGPRAGPGQHKRCMATASMGRKCLSTCIPTLLLLLSAIVLSQGQGWCGTCRPSETPRLGAVAPAGPHAPPSALQQPNSIQSVHSTIPNITQTEAWAMPGTNPAHSHAHMHVQQIWPLANTKLVDPNMRHKAPSNSGPLVRDSSPQKRQPKAAHAKSLFPPLPCSLTQQLAAGAQLGIIYAGATAPHCNADAHHHGPPAEALGRFEWGEKSHFPHWEPAVAANGSDKLQYRCLPRAAMSETFKLQAPCADGTVAEVSFEVDKQKHDLAHPTASRGCLNVAAVIAASLLLISTCTLCRSRTSWHANLHHVDSEHIGCSSLETKCMGGQTTWAQMVTARAPGQPYFEHQVAQFCMIHAFNAAMGSCYLRASATT